MISQESPIKSKQLQPLIRHCWECNIYTKKLSKISFKEKFINFLIIDGKKSKAYKLFNQTGVLTRKKILQNYYQKVNRSFTDHPEIILKMKILFFVAKTIDETNSPPNSYQEVKNKQSDSENIWITNKIYDSYSAVIANRKKIPSFDKIILQAIDNVKPSLEVRKVRIAGTTYLVPAIIPKKRQQTLAIKWIIESAKKRKRKANISFAECLAVEVIDAYLRQGQAKQKRDDLHKLAEANRAYTRYRWW